MYLFGWWWKIGNSVRERKLCSFTCKATKQDALSELVGAANGVISKEHILEGKVPHAHRHLAAALCFNLAVCQVRVYFLIMSIRKNLRRHVHSMTRVCTRVCCSRTRASTYGRASMDTETHKFEQGTAYNTGVCAKLQTDTEHTIRK